MMIASRTGPTMPISAPAEALPATLTAVLDELWRRIADGVGGRWPPWGLPALATLATDGPRVRVLALRGVDAKARRFTFHTDARSDKARELAADPRVSVVFWDPVDAIEARFTGTATLHRGDAITRAAWREVSPLRQMACAIEASPGDDIGASKRFDALPADSDDEIAFGHFAVIAVEASAIDWLWLGPQDLRRACFRWTGVDWSASWVVP
jgi:pyridoxamine 5'-phosphate oxidase